MGWFNRKKESRADETTVTPPADDVLLKALLGSTTITKEQALNIPALKSCINFVADAVSMLPIKLYKQENGKAIEVKDDIRTKLLNDDTGDTLDAVQFWRALLSDYFLGKGGYAYIGKEKNQYRGLYYVDETNISIIKNVDPIFKDYDILVNGKTYKPYDFIKLLRNTKDGAQGISIIEENSLILSVAYNSLVYEENLVKKGGNKKGFLKSQRKLGEVAIEALKTAWRNLYSNNSENVVVLNDGLEFQEASNTSVEMQLNENKETNSAEICKLFNIPVNIIKGTASSKEYTNGFKMGVMPVLIVIQCALNRELLLEKEKSSFYFAFDTKEMLKGDIKERFEAYKTGIEANFLQIDEVRFMEDLPALGLKWIKLGLDSVLYDVETKTIYTPNTNQTSSIDNLKGGENDANRNKE
ncbi:phage portal protein [Clostridium magnum]|uniref:Phage portal protein n=1 Tax=Clostridium magnum DSM 2767 TaxID=1121326 RepID=A0A161X249_9CLOT|nr:phage portal protein [Clostridium magnum]KZL93548.1 phage portal protein [Clostridium magnum DSM 2767]SHI61080.1 phage portal protein, HK97 family [Clostridium magnum DSM 2767]